ncbi:MAG: hypothetical protein OXT65_04575 [Alphaproteobacteria bacterium]|nr:hypothetical protein [Alphaproteobacteria bacterium]
MSNAMNKVWRTYSFLMAIMVLPFMLVSSVPASAQTCGPVTSACETSGSADPILEEFMEHMIDYFDYFITEVGKHIEYELESVAAEEVNERLIQFDEYMYPPVEDWWDDGSDPDINATSTLPALKAMAHQLSFAKVDQTRQIGSFLDALMVNERIRARQSSRASARKRYNVSESSCQMDSLALSGGQGQAYRLSHDLARTMALVDTKRRNNHLDVISPPVVASAEKDWSLIKKAHAAPGAPSGGFALDLTQRWGEYTADFCDPSKGDQGCAAAGTMPGCDRDIPGLIWGDRQTIDMRDSQNRQCIEAALRNLVSPFVPDPLARTVLDSDAGRREMLYRRARDARLNAIMNGIKMLAERGGGGTGADVRDVRVAGGMVDYGGLPSNVAAPGDASYSEIRNAMLRSRVMNPAYITRLVTQGDAVAREYTSVKAAGHQLTADLIKRVEEMMFMEAAAYAHTLDMEPEAGASKDIPG